MTRRIFSLLVTVLVLAHLAARADAASFVVMADINGRYGSIGYHPRVSLAVQRIIELKPDFVILAGDMVAGQQSPPLKPERLHAMWRAFDATVAAPLRGAGIDLIPTAGNHDASAYPDFTTDREAYASYWSAIKPPGQVLPDSRYPWHFATVLGETLIISLYASVPERLPIEQEAFLRKILTEHAKQYKRILMVSHLPVFPISQGRERDVLDADSLQPLLASFGVDWFISGHHHAFYAGQAQTGPIHLASAALGGNRRKWVGSELFSDFGFARVDDHGMISFYTDPDFEPTTPKGIPDKIGVLRLRADKLSEHGNLPAGQLLPGR